MDERACRFQPAILVDGADHRFHGVRQHTGVFPAAGQLFTVRQLQVFGKADSTSDAGQRITLRQRGETVTDLAFVLFCIAFEQQISQHQTEHPVPQKLHTLV